MERRDLMVILAVAIFGGIVVYIISRKPPQEVYMPRLVPPRELGITEPKTSLLKYIDQFLFKEAIPPGDTLSYYEQWALPEGGRLKLPGMDFETPQGEYELRLTI